MKRLLLVEDEPGLVFTLTDRLAREGYAVEQSADGESGLERAASGRFGYNAMPSTRTVDVHLACLRQKLEPAPKYPRFILTVHGLGYRFAG